MSRSKGQAGGTGKWAGVVGKRATYAVSSIPGWCYLCNEAHLYQYPCGQLEAYGKRIERNRRRRERAA